jgi:hypothetical protein
MHVLLVLVSTKRAVFCWQCFSDLGLALIVYLCCLRQCSNLVGTAWSLLFKRAFIFMVLANPKYDTDPCDVPLQCFAYFKCSSVRVAPELSQL